MTQLRAALLIKSLSLLVVPTDWLFWKKAKAEEKEQEKTANPARQKVYTENYEFVCLENCITANRAILAFTPEATNL